MTSTKEATVTLTARDLGMNRMQRAALVLASIAPLIPDNVTINVLGISYPGGVNVQVHSDHVFAEQLAGKLGLNTMTIWQGADYEHRYWNGRMDGVDVRVVVMVALSVAVTEAHTAAIAEDLHRTAAAALLAD